MPRLITLALWLTAVILCGSLLAANGDLGAPPARVGLNVDVQPTFQSVSKMPLSFTKNMGQWDERVLFRTNSGGAAMWFTKEGITYQFTRRIGEDNTPPVGPLSRGDSRPAGTPNSYERIPLSRGDSLSSTGTVLNESIPLLRGVRGVSDKDSIEQLVLTAKFVGANANPEIIVEGQMGYKCNYFLGNDPTKWHTDVPNFEAITLKDIYPGIDLKYTGDGNGQAAYEFIAAPGADIAQIKVAYEGAEGTSLDAEGNLIVRTTWGNVIAGLKSPVDSPRPVGEGSWVRAVLSGSTACAWSSSSTTSPPYLAHGDVRQALAEKSGTLTLSYSTYLGGSAEDRGYGIAIDGGGNAYMTGVTHSAAFPTQNPYQTDQGGRDVFVTKLSGSGTLIYSTYLGGGNYDEGYGIAVDGRGNAYATGWTNSLNYPTLNPFQTRQGRHDVFVTKLSSFGTLVYSTYLGGGDNDEGYGIAVDSGGSAYATGYVTSSNFPTLNPYQSTNQGYFDVFVTKLSSLGALIYSTYLGGENIDEGYGIAVDDGGNAFVTGITSSYDFPTLNSYQTFQGADVFVTKLSSTGNSLIYSTYIGGGNYDWGNGITVDGGGNAYVTGATWSSDFPTSNPYQATYQGGLYDAFVTKLSNSGNTLVYSTYLGGGDDDYGCGIAIDDGGDAYVSGVTSSSSFPTSNPYQTDQGTIDAFVTKLSSSGSSLIYSTYIGGAGDDYGYGIAVDGGGTAYVTGETFSSNFPTQNPFQTHQGTVDAFVFKLTWTHDYFCGDVNTDEQVNLLDAVFLINYIFVGGPAPQTLSLADVDCSGRINVADVVRLINYVFSSGPAPCAECE